MKKPRNRKERISFLIQKEGRQIVEMLAACTDSEVKRYFDRQWDTLKNMPDYVEVRPICIRCHDEVFFHDECKCGMNRAVYNEEMWLDDIKNNSGASGWIKSANEEFLKRRR